VACFPEYIFSIDIIRFDLHSNKESGIADRIHFLANWTQGVLLGFGVSGNREASLMKPEFLQVACLVWKQIYLGLRL